ncbi:MAG TPA: hypothetical protein VMZ04_00320 [Anaerolineae bacterium]|nr:hypothetical protein [Anaerolineae bacterium]
MGEDKEKGGDKKMNWNEFQKEYKEYLLVSYGWESTLPQRKNGEEINFCL